MTEHKAERAPWGDFPAVVRNGDLKDLSKEPEYEAAKHGDPAAALAIARRLMKPETVDSVKAMIGDQKPKVVPVLAVESGGNNKIPLMAAHVLADRLGLEVEYSIVQAEKVGRTNSNA
ncbi:phosphoribosyltransferase, partial [Aeromonas caviae]